MTNKYNPNDLLLNRDDQKYVKRQREAFYIALPQFEAERYQKGAT